MTRQALVVDDGMCKIVITTWWDEGGLIPNWLYLIRRRSSHPAQHCLKTFRRSLRMKVCSAKERQSVSRTKITADETKIDRHPIC